MANSLDSSVPNSANVGNNAPAAITSMTTAGAAGVANDLAIATAIGAFGAGAQVGQTPGAGWTVIGDQFYKLVPSGALSVSQAFGGTLYNAVQLLIFLKTTGILPVWTQRGGQNGNTVLTPPAFVPTAGNSLLWIVDSAGTPNGSNLGATVSDNVGLVWVPITDIFVQCSNANGSFKSNMTAFYTENIPGVSISTTLTIPRGGGTWKLWELSNIAKGGLRLLASTGVGI